MYRNYFLE